MVSELFTPCGLRINPILPRNFLCLFPITCVLITESEERWNTETRYQEIQYENVRNTTIPTKHIYIFTQNVQQNQLSDENAITR